MKMLNWFLKIRKTLNFVKIVGFIGAMMPLWNIPFVINILKMKSSHEVSLVWMFGVWISILCLLPQSLKSLELNFKIFGILNITLFSLVLIVVLYYR